MDLEQKRANAREQENDVHGTISDYAEGRANKGLERIAVKQGRIPPLRMEDDYKKRAPATPVRSTKISESTMQNALEAYNQTVSLTKNSDAERPNRLLRLSYVNKRYQRQGQNGIEDFMRQSSTYGNRRSRREGSLSHVTTQEREDVDLRLAMTCLECEASDLDHDTGIGLNCSLVSGKSLCLSCPAYNKCT